ncbi:hypothetical protein [Dactylosporangium sp. CA-092794]|uniref:hypothetical protein n=1 Tax=Dactylosporangium sp. CA-092794 TaxID=3239929 RepID=UPI003D92B372
MAARIGAVIAAAVVLVLALGTPASAHGGAAVTIRSDGRGSVWITAQWQDGHPISEPTTVTLTAAAGDASIAPAVLHQTGDERGTQTYTGTLAPGSWHVSIDLGPPVTGHCQALIQVTTASATPLPAEVACLIPATAPSTSTSAGGSLTPLWLTLAALAVAAAAIATVRLRRRA